MSLDFNVDYSNHTLLDNKFKYSKIFKLSETSADAVSTGDLLLIQAPCGKYVLYMATRTSDEDGTLHLTRYSEVDIISAEKSDDTGLIISTSSPCGC